MIAAFDVHYSNELRACAAAVLFNGYGDAEPAAVAVKCLGAAAGYVPGAFCRRELPCILSVIGELAETPDEMVVDGYVKLGGRPGLGQRLYDAFRGRIPVIGVAKSRFEGADAVDVFRGGSRRPLFVTAAGVDWETAADMVRSMHGKHRIPTLLKRVDLLAREGG